MWDSLVMEATGRDIHTSTFRKEKSSSTPAAGAAVVFGAATVETGHRVTGAGVIVVGVVVVVAVVVVLVVAGVEVVIMLEFLTIAARNAARVDGMEPCSGSISWTHKHKIYSLLHHHSVLYTRMHKGKFCCSIHTESIH
jgi:hypothetical protein